VGHGVTRILGIDPGSWITGYGVIDMHTNRATHLAHGALRLPEGELPARLKAIFDGVTAIILEFQPAEMAVERVFMNRNADSALKLGQARGAAIVAGVNLALPIFEFTPAQIKQAIVGKGNADKTQIQHMIRLLLNLQETPGADAADALAVALCHGHTREGLARMQGVQGLRNGRLR
jgi:crossover junction endodeoxyribonuclease RuvC